MKNKFLATAICLAFMTFPLCSCGNESSASQDISSENTSDTVFGEGKSPDNSGNYLLDTSIHLLGKDITLPCTFSEFGDIRFDISTAIPRNENDLYGAVYIDDYRIGRVIISEFNSNDDVSDNIVTYIELKPDFGFDDLDVKYNGFDYKTSKSKIIESFGKPDEEYNNNVCYYLDNDGYVEFEFTNDFNEIESFKIKSQ